MAKMDERFTRISKRIIEALYARKDLSRNELRVALYVIEHTYGTYDAAKCATRTRAPFSGKIIGDALRIDRADAKGYLRSLVERKILIRYQESQGPKPGVYGIEKRIENWVSTGGKTTPTTGGLVGGKSPPLSGGKTTPTTGGKTTPTSGEESLASIAIPAALDIDKSRYKSISSSFYSSVDPGNPEEEPGHFLPPGRREALRSKVHQALLQTQPAGLPVEAIRRMNRLLSLPPPAGMDGETWGRRLVAAVSAGIEKAVADKLAGANIRSIPLVALSNANQNLGTQAFKQTQEQQTNKGVTFIQ